MISAKQQIDEIVTSLRQVIAPAIVEPYPKAQAYMAAVILEFVARQIEERGDIERDKGAALRALFHELSLTPELNRLSELGRLIGRDEPDQAALHELIEQLYHQRQQLGEEVFAKANHRIRQTLRRMLDEDLKVAKGA
ncbi:MAG: hypothetical protein ACREQ4_07145 [Candidatus Binataceae bacterium]